VPEEVNRKLPARNTTVQLLTLQTERHTDGRTYDIWYQEPIILRAVRSAKKQTRTRHEHKSMRSANGRLTAVANFGVKIYVENIAW